MRFVLLALLVACGGPQHSSSTSGDPLDGVPPAAAHSLRAQAGGAPIERVEHETENGVEVWEGSWHDGGKVHEVSVTADGRVVENEVEDKNGDADDDERGDDRDDDNDRDEN